jgi:hypothetical protein
MTITCKEPRKPSPALDSPVKPGNDKEKKMGVDEWAQTKAKKVRDTYFKEKFKL